MKFSYGRNQNIFHFFNMFDRMKQKWKKLWGFFFWLSCIIIGFCLFLMGISLIGRQRFTIQSGKKCNFRFRWQSLWRMTKCKLKCSQLCMYARVYQRIMLFFVFSFGARINANCQWKQWNDIQFKSIKCSNKFHEKIKMSN